MSPACRNTPEGLRKLVRGEASEAERLALEAHVAGCEACQREQAMHRLLEPLRAEPPELSDIARTRALRGVEDALAEPHPAQPWALLSRLAFPTAAVAFGLGALLLLRPGTPASKGGEPLALVGARSFEASGPSAVTFAGAEMKAEAAVALHVDEARRTVVLERGVLEVEVKPGGAGRFRVESQDFVVEVVGTRFRVAADRVETLHGRVRVLGRDGGELAVLSEGQVWTRPAAKAPPADAPLLERGPQLLEPGVDARFERTRDALAAGRADAARSELEAVSGLTQSDAQRAEAGLLRADLALLEHKPGGALEAWSEVMARWPDSGAAETAAFARCQLLVEQHRDAEAKGALEGLMRRWPQGRFVAEGRQLLTELNARAH